MSKRSYQQAKTDYINKSMSDGNSIGRAASGWTKEGKGDYYANEMLSNNESSDRDHGPSSNYGDDYAHTESDY